jgi:elongation factor G
MNKMDRVGADFFMSVRSMVERLDANPVPVQIPIGAEDAFRGPIDLVTMKGLYYDDETLGASYTEGDIPENLLPLAREYREKMIESLADIDDAIMEKYLNKEEIGTDEIKAVLRRGTLERKLTPVVCGTAFRNKGVQLLLDAIVDYAQHRFCYCQAGVG